MRDRQPNVQAGSETGRALPEPGSRQRAGHDLQRTSPKRRRQTALSAILLTLITGAVILSMLLVTQAPRTGISDNFDRADGVLGHGWVASTDGWLRIASHAVVGTAGGLAGEVRVAGSFGANEYSQIEVTSTQLSGNEWIGPTVRSQNGGLDTYLGMYLWNSGDPELRLYKRTAGTWTQLGKSYASGPLPTGTKLRLTAVGSEISFEQDGTDRIAVTDR